MTLNYSDRGIFEKYVLNEFWYRELEGKILVTTPQSSWVLLSKEEFDLLRLNKICENPDLFRVLKKGGVIITKSNKNRIVEDYRKRYHRLFTPVKLQMINTTLRCTQKCVYCQSESKPILAEGYDMDETTAKAVVDFIFQTPIDHLTIEFEGGEPLANFPIIRYVIEYSKKLNKSLHKDITYRVVSNLDLMNKDILGYLIKNKVFINTTFDGPKRVHDKNRRERGGKGNYEKVTHWIDVIKNHYNYPIKAIAVITKYSLPYAKEIIDEYLKLNLGSIHLRQLRNAGYAHVLWNKIGYSPEQFLKFWKEAVDYILNSNKKGLFIKEVTFEFLTKRILSIYDGSDFVCFGAPCGAALSQCSYNYNGDIYTCDESKSFNVFKLGNVKESTYKEIFTSPSVSRIRALSSGESFLCSSCVWHPYCGPCLVCTYGQQGSLIPDLSLDQECKIRGGMVEYTFKKLLFSEEDREIMLRWIKYPHNRINF